MAPVGAARAGVYGGADAIPDSVVSRSDDNTSISSDPRKFGIVFNVQSDWSVIGFKISANVSGATDAEIYRESDQMLMGSKDISGLSAGDTFTMNAGLSGGADYRIVLDATDYTVGRNSSVSYPISSSDGELEMLSGCVETDQTIAGNAYNIVEIGNVGFA